MPISFVHATSPRQTTRTPTATSRARVLVLGPNLSAVGGGPMHLRKLFQSRLANIYDLSHFEVGSRGRESPSRDEGAISMVARLAASPIKLLYVLVLKRPQVIHINTSLNHKSFWRDLIYTLLAKIFTCKVVYQVHGGSLARFGANRFMRSVCRFATSLTDAVVVLSSAEKAHFDHIHSRVTVIPNAIDLQEYLGSPRERAPGVTRLVYLGRLVRDKGLFELLQAMKKLGQEPKFSALQLLIAGSGAEQTALASRIRELNLTTSTRLVGPIFGKEKVEFLRTADVLIFPSYHEGLPYTVIESLAAGTPVIASRVGGIPDVISDGVHGILIEPRSPEQIVEAVKRLVENPEVAAQMSNNCLAHAKQNYGLDRLSDRFDNLYRDILNGK